MRKTKIVCTLGPATDQPGVLEELISSGMNVARLNFSHGDYEEHKGRMDRVKEIRRKMGLPIALLLDTKGPEIRIKDFVNGSIELKKGQLFTLMLGDELGNEEKVAITCDLLYKDVEPGVVILIDDGLIAMEVEEVVETDIICRVLNCGKISNRKGVNVPGVHLSLPYISAKDRQDLVFGVNQDIDYVAASFVRSKKDVMEVRNILDTNGGQGIRLISKIENQEGVDHIDEIIEASDGIMIARGDMGVEIPGEEVPIIQKMIIKKVYEAGKQVITATQMLDSMMKNPRPTRAETADVANAVYDGTSAIMLSGETAAGSYPVEALTTMVRIAERVEEDIDYRKRFFSHERPMNPDITDAVSHATCTTAHDLNAKGIITVTKSGRTARMISRYRPECPIIGCTTSERIWRQMNMSWGVFPVLIDEKDEMGDLFTHSIEAAVKSNYLQKGDITVITSGIPLGVSGSTNMIKVQVVQ